MLDHSVAQTGVICKAFHESRVKLLHILHAGLGFFRCPFIIQEFVPYRGILLQTIFVCFSTSVFVVYWWYLNIGQLMGFKDFYFHLWKNKLMQFQKYVIWGNVTLKTVNNKTRNQLDASVNCIRAQKIKGVILFLFITIG